MSKRMYDLWMVDLDDSWHELNMKWLVIKVTWLWYDKGFDVFTENLICVWLGRNSLNL